MRLPLFHQESETGHTAGGMALQEGSLDEGPLRNPTNCAPRKVHHMHRRCTQEWLQQCSSSQSQPTTCRRKDG